MKIKGKGVPIGRYTAEFAGVKGTSNEMYGDGFLWQFYVVGGPYEGQETGRITSDRATRKNSCGRIYAAVTGRPFSPTDNVDTDLFIGRRYRIKVGETENGSTRVEDAELIDDASPEVAAPASKATSKAAPWESGPPDDEIPY